MLLALFLLLLAGTAAGAESEPRPLRLGVFPYAKLSLVKQQYAGLAEALADALKRPVTIETTSDFASFIWESNSRRYDLLVTAPQLVGFQIERGDYELLAAVDVDTTASIFVKRGSEISELSMLRGKSVAVTDPLAFPTVVCTEVLRMHGLEPGESVYFVKLGSYDDALFALFEGQVDAAITVTLFAELLPPNLTSDLQTLYRTRTLPAALILANTELSKSERARIRSLLLRFGRPKGTPENELSPLTFREVSEEEIPRLLTYREMVAKELEKLLREKAEPPSAP